MVRYDLPWEPRKVFSQERFESTGLSGPLIANTMRESNKSTVQISQLSTECIYAWSSVILLDNETEYLVESSTSTRYNKAAR